MNNIYFMTNLKREKRKSGESNEELNESNKINNENNLQCNKLQKMHCTCLKRKIEEIESYINTNKNIEALEKLLKKFKIEEYSAYDYDIY